MQFNTSLTSILSAATSKADWASKLQSALGSSIRLRMFRDANASAADPTATGVEFLNLGITGPFTIVGGNITGFGTLSGTTVRAAADLLTGKSAVSIEGNGNKAVFTLGLTRARQSSLGVADANLQDFEYTLYSQPTATSGLGFLTGTGIKSPISLPSGTGPAAPALDAKAPARYEVFAYPNDDNTPVSAGVGLINVRDSDMVFDRDYIAKSVGDVRVMRSAAGSGVVIGTGGECFRFAPTLLASNPVTNADDNTKPVYRLRILAIPHGRWANYPYRGNFNIATDTTILPPHKIAIYAVDGTTLDIIEMYSTRVNNVPGSGKPVNSRTQTLDYTVAPSQPYFTCHMSHSWASANYRPMLYMNSLFPGVESDAMSEYNVTAFDAAPDQWPVISGNYLTNGLSCYRVAPKWSRINNGGFDTTTIDPLAETPARDSYRTQLVGYGFEPGSSCQHVWYMSPGGSRHDRGMWADIVVGFVTNPAGVRVHGSVPYKELYRNYTFGYHNEGCHYATNPELGQTILKSHVLYGTDCYQDCYYQGSDENYRPDLPNTGIRLLISSNAVHTNPFKDFKGRIFTNEYDRDDQHNIPNAANMLYFGGDPMGALEAVDSFNSSMLATFNMTQAMNPNDFLTRQHAWFLKHLPEMWAIANNNPNCFSSSDIEFIAGNHLERVYNVIAPLLDPANTSNLGICLRTFGTTGGIIPYGSTQTVISLYDSKQYYMSLIMMFAKQTGFYDRMRAYSTKAAQALDMIILCLNKASIDFFVDAKGRPEQMSFNAAINLFYTTTTPPNPLNWATASMYYQDGTAVGLTDFIRTAAGTIAPGQNYIEGFNTQHYRAQWPWVLKNYFPEVTYARRDQAISIVDQFYADVETLRANGGKYWHWRFKMMGKPKVPAKVGPPVVS